MLKEDEDDHTGSIPIIMLSAKDSEADQIVGRVIGASAYVAKPFEFPELLKEIVRLHLWDEMGGEIGP